MLWTMRSGVPVEWVDEQWKAIDCNKGEPLAHAVDWCRERGIEFWAINENPQQTSWAKDSRKQYAHIYIDDAAFGCPLIHDKNIHCRPFVDWTQVGQAMVTIHLTHQSET